MACWLALLAMAGPALGQSTLQRPAETDPDLERVAYIERTLELNRGDAEVWWTTWVVAYGALTAGNLFAAGMAPHLAASKAPDRVAAFRIGAVMSAGTSLLGLLSLGFNPSKAMRGADDFKHLPEGTPAEREAKRLAAEAALEAAAQRQDFGRGWLSHLAGLLVNSAAGLVTWFVLEEPSQAGLKFGAGMAISQAQIWSQPTRASEAWVTYQQRYGTSALPEAEVVWRLAPYPAGLGLHVSFR